MLQKRLGKTRVNFCFSHLKNADWIINGVSHPVFSIFAQHEFHDIVQTTVDAPVNWTEPEVSAYPDDYYYTIRSNYQPGSTFPIGRTVVTYTVMDNIATCDTYSFAVLVEGNCLIVYDY